MGGEIEIHDNTIPMGTIISNTDDDRVIYIDEPIYLFMIGKELQRIALLKNPSINPVPMQMWCEDDKPATKFLLKGRMSLSDSELLSIIIGN